MGSLRYRPMSENGWVTGYIFSINNNGKQFSRVLVPFTLSAAIYENPCGFMGPFLVVFVLSCCTNDVQLYIH